MTSELSIILVTHNSAADIQFCLDCIGRQSSPVDKVIIIDSGSANTDYLSSLQYEGELDVQLCANIGYGKANNIGYSKVAQHDNAVVLFINPDTYLKEDFCEVLLEKLEHYPDVAVFTGRLLGFDRKSRKPTGKIDSTGIFRRWFGRWQDRGRGMVDNGQFMTPEIGIPAACGALLCCRVRDLHYFEQQIFDPDFFLYKEDIEFSLRLQSLGKKIGYFPDLSAYHCRGWQMARQTMPHRLRMIAARNEIKLYQKHPSPYIIWALWKLFLVRFLKV